MAHIFDPPETASSPDISQLRNMRLDPQHYTRAYGQCRGSGRTHEQCIDIPVDGHILPANPLLTSFQKEITDAIVCMTEYRDIDQCRYFTDALYHKVTPEEPTKPTLFSRLSFAKQVLLG